ncbi:hypothetical protein FD29_GL001218 [Companilactobacillus mindensis DSM 14500]|uniref:GIY-YIG domain-containing protein n=1 Tax=Companilactobacillus mindensis DSM 14500 TaxID=1423770 RepID=A0A0R1QE87_9LACO|nr:hypothetical protein [Companilactobacillus mindensis]KRL43104.1 hypothetical protein FD29_GL001218 [Companilactobacillus mindensis DSM 14500]GEO78948.1 hypothetical protein LMI01_12790 [Companilactobacillus mindensis]
MAKNIFITDNHLNDDVIIYNREPVIVCLADRKDIKSLTRVEESKVAGIYILLGKEKRYVGRAFNSVLNQLVRQDKNKKWWNQVIFFGREDGLLDGSQINYLERKLTELFKKLNVSLDSDNLTRGNNYFIEKLNEKRADELWSVASDIILNIANIDLLKGEVKSINVDNQVVETIRDDKPFKLNDGFNTYEGNSARAAYINLVKGYLDDERMRSKLLKRVTIGKPTAKNLLGTKLNMSPKGTQMTRELKNGINLYVNFSKNDLVRASLQIGRMVGRDIEANWK